MTEPCLDLVGQVKLLFFLFIFFFFLRDLRVDPKIATAQFTSSSISTSISTRNLPSFQGLQLSTVKVSPSVEHLGVGSGLSQRALRGLVASMVVFSSAFPFLKFINVCY